MATVFHTRLYSRFIETYSNLRRKTARFREPISNVVAIFREKMRFKISFSGVLSKTDM